MRVCCHLNCVIEMFGLAFNLVGDCSNYSISELHLEIGAYVLSEYHNGIIIMSSIHLHLILSESSSVTHKINQQSLWIQMYRDNHPFHSCLLVCTLQYVRGKINKQTTENPL